MSAPTATPSPAARESEPCPTTPPEPLAPAPRRLLQLTDPHLFGQPGQRLLGITTRASFESVLALALGRSQPADALILTGDLVHDESAAGYAYLRETVERLGLPCYCIAGNHDRSDLMRDSLGGLAVESLGIRRLPPWRLIFLESVIPGLARGCLRREQLDRLDSLLAGDDSPTLIFLHHHPLPVASAWIDTVGTENGADLLRICESHAQVKAVTFGHVHQAFAERRGALQILGTPSTCIQFLPGSAGFALDERLPGYREFLLSPDGRLSTQVVRLERYREAPAPIAAGY